MEKVLEFLKESGYFMIATVEGDQPRVRPFGILLNYQGKLYFHTGRKKRIYQQLMADPKVELCAMTPDKRWMRLWGTAVEDPSYEASDNVLNHYPHLRKMYAPDDGNCTTFYLKDVTVSFSTLGQPDEIITL